MNRPLSHLGFQAAQTEAPPASDPPSAEVIQSQLERILGSPQFRDSLRLTRFLSFVVATTLAGKSGCIKAYTIATQALDRDSDFDPQNDPIVRVEAGRLRQALARYYAKDGRDDPVLIDLPRGTYVPSFRGRATAPPQNVDGTDAVSADVGPKTPIQKLDATQQLHRSVRDTVALVRKHSSQFVELSSVIRSSQETINQSRDLLKSSAVILGGLAPLTAETPAPAALEQPDKPSGASSPEGWRIAPLINRFRTKAGLFKIAFAAIAVLAILEAAFDIDRPLVGGANHGLWYKIWPGTNAGARQPVGGEGAPAIYVEPVTAVGQPVEGLFPPKVIRERLIDALARYDDVTVVTDEPDRAARGGGATPESQRPRAIYRLATTIRYGDDMANLIVQLIDTRDAALVWSRQYDRPVKPHARRPNGSIAPDVARSLLDPFGVIQARERVRLAAANPLTDTYRCILDANEYLRGFNPSEYRPVSDCLQQASERTPPSVTAFADLAFVFLRNYRFGIATAPGDPAMLDNAYAMAARAVDIRPDSAFAQYALSAALLAKGDVARAKIASEKSYALNPDDGAVAFGRATVLILTGEVDAGLALLNKASVKSPNSWVGYHLLMALGSYLKGDLKTARAESREVANPLYPPGLMLDALIAARAGDRAHAQQDIAMLYQFYPAWRQDFRASVGRYLPEPMAGRIAADFKVAAADTMQ
jgi:adenylate cyclase